MVGVRRTKDDDSIVLFDLSTAENIHREVQKENEEIIIKTIIDDYLIEHFGTDFYEDVYSMRLYLMDLFKKWNLDAELVPVEGTKEWLVQAKELVNKHLSKLMEV